MIMKESVVSVLVPTTADCAPGAPEKGKLQVTQTSHRYVILEAKKANGLSKKIKVDLWENIWDMTTY